jgi:2-polyprenyl-3-methyl-5-hydroxy-6-metoxy-1,4-benzoquinol methylase
MVQPHSEQSESAQRSGWASYSGEAWETRKPVHWLEDWPFWRDVLARHTAPKSTVLELACGNGRITCQIAAEGYAVVAIDLNPHFLSRAQRHLTESSVFERVELYLADVVQLDLSRQFDICVMIDWAFPAILTQRDQVTFFQRLNQHLRKGGVFAFDTIFPAIRQQGMSFDGDIFRWEDGRTYDTLRQIETRYSGDQRLYFRHTSLSEIRLLADATGFEIIERFGNYDGRPLRGVPGDNLTLVMRKVL